MIFRCKKTSCGNVIHVDRTAKHASTVKCSRCRNVVKYCLDCKNVYLNFRKHRNPGHRLYTFQREEQNLVRGRGGLFVSPTYKSVERPPMVTVDIDGAARVLVGLRASQLCVKQ
jgi:hypothetical protein